LAHLGLNKINPIAKNTAPMIKNTKNQNIPTNSAEKFDVLDIDL